ncbi:MAG: hypothetical protein IH586_19155, partial [Anaerolineaceae bacterium]|nr:hypothetical protein [Anaerolineaceae bacterium]
MFITLCMVIGLSACALVPRAENILLPTLVATLALPEQASATVNPTQTVTLEPWPTDPDGTPTLAETSTETVTPWVNDTPTAGPSPTAT